MSVSVSVFVRGFVSTLVYFGCAPQIVIPGSDTGSSQEVIDRGHMLHCLMWSCAVFHSPERISIVQSRSARSYSAQQYSQMSEIEGSRPKQAAPSLLFLFADQQ